MEKLTLETLDQNVLLYALKGRRQSAVEQRSQARNSILQSHVAFATKTGSSRDPFIRRSFSVSVARRQSLENIEKVYRNKLIKGKIIISKLPDQSIALSCSFLTGYHHF